MSSLEELERAYLHEVQLVVAQNEKLAALPPEDAKLVIEKWLTAQTKPRADASDNEADQAIQVHQAASVVQAAPIIQPALVHQAAPVDQAVQNANTNEGRQGQPRPPAWTPEELDHARQLRAMGLTLSEVAEDLGRTVNSVTARLWRDKGGDPKKADKERKARGDGY